MSIAAAFIIGTVEMLGVLTWGVALAVWRLGRIESRWTGENLP